MSSLVYLNGLGLFDPYSLAESTPFPPPEPFVDKSDSFDGICLTETLKAMESVFTSCLWNVSAAPEGLQFIHQYVDRYKENTWEIIEKIESLFQDNKALEAYALSELEKNKLTFTESVEDLFIQIFARKPYHLLLKDFNERSDDGQLNRAQLFQELCSFSRDNFNRKNDKELSFTRSLILTLSELYIALNEYDKAEEYLGRLEGTLNDLRYDDAIFRINWYKKNSYPRLEEIGHELKEYFCPLPWVEYQMLKDKVGHCCYEWLPNHIDNIFEVSKSEEVFDGKRTSYIRRSIQEGSYRYCSKDKCRFLSENRLQKKVEARNNPNLTKIIDEELTSSPDRFENIYLAYDPTCNLSCPSCRDQLIVADKTDRNRYMKATREHIIPILSKTNIATCSGYGDPFASHVFRNMLLDMKPEKLDGFKLNLMTNGLLFTPGNWDKYLSHLSGNISSISVSIDAAHSETYSKIRRGGDFERLKENLLFIKKLFSEKKFEWFQINFIIQKNNYREIIDFVKLGYSLNVSAINFQELYYWPEGHTYNEFKEWAVHEADHPEHLDFLNALKDPLLNDPIIMHDLKRFMPKQKWQLYTKEQLKDPLGKEREGFWFQDEKLGALWTSYEMYPEMHQANTERKLIYKEASWKPRLFRYNDEKNWFEA